MSRQQRFQRRAIAVLVGTALASGGSNLFAATTPSTAGIRLNTITWQDMQAAAKRAATKGFKPAPMGAVTTKTTTTTSPGGAVTTGPGGAVMPGPGTISMAPGAVPHYFSRANYANSPLRMPVALVRVVNAVGDTTGTGAAAAANVDASGAIIGFTIISAGSGYTAPPTIEITPVGGGTGAGAAATAVLTDGGLTGVTVDAPGASYFSPGIRKFVDTLPGLDAAGANNLGNYIPVAVPNTTKYPGSDYYEIELGEYTQQFHSDLPPTKLRGYRQVGSTYHYLGPIIVASKDRPVRIKFINSLPTGAGGNLFIPVDTTVMGAGEGPSMPVGGTPQQPVCSGAGAKPAGCYTENRATLHLHGGINPWISDGTPHQWITPAGEATTLQQGASVRAVPDMAADDTGAPGDGVMTFFWPNQQSARLMFYHDHAHGITRLNVYAGEAAGYLLTDAVEQKLVADGILPAEQIPLVIQDKTFVPDPVWQLPAQDDTWDATRWGGMGNLWLPHVYSPAQNPGDSSGVNQFGRWAYGPWFWPPTTAIDHGPIANPYYDANCNPDLQWCEPPQMPGTPYISMGMEAFHDTPLVNGTAYPTVTLQPKPYRLRILNAANDRFMNLSMYQAVDAAGAPCVTATATPETTGIACTEVALNPAEVAAALTDPAGVFPTPVSNPGPNWIQIGTEGGFLPAPVEIPPQPITWVTDPTVFNAGNVDKHSLLLGPAERADVVVDLSAYAGKTLILYNDAPAAFPARDPRYDYYTGNPDLTDTGGAPSTPRGYGPNTRTVMQIKVADAPAAPAFDLAALQAKFAHHTVPDPVDPVNNPPVPAGVFESSQPPIIVGQGAYNSAYGSTFQNSGPNAGLVQIFDTQFSFKTLDGGSAGPSVTVPLGPKMIQDEMGEAFEPKYGRMSGNLGVETPNATAGNQNMLLYAYPHPPTEVIKGLPLGVTASQIGSADDNTQIWKITHNGVDTHPIHFHLYDVQLVNRVGWDGIIRKPDANELGWKDTVRISPLEDTIVALRPRVPTLPFELPNSVRLLDPSMPAGAVLSLGPTFAPNGQPVTITNHVINFGAEYVWHCHILSHEEMDMMRPQAIALAPKAPTVPAVTVGGAVSWTDNSISETGFLVQRANDATFTTGLVEFTAPANSGPVGTVVSYTDSTAVNGSSYAYRVKAINVVGDTQSYNGNFFPTMTAASDFTEAVTTVIDKPALPGLTGLTATRLNATATLPVRVRLNWTYTWPAGAGTANFVIERSADGVTFAQVGTAAKAARNWTDNSLVPGATAVTYTYRIRAVTTTNQTSAWNSVTADIPAAMVAPSNLAGTGFRVGATNNARVTLTWTDVAGETTYSVQRADDAAFTVGVVTTNNIAANAVTWTSGNLARGRTYYYRIRANNTVVGNSAWSAGIAVTTPLN